MQSDAIGQRLAEGPVGQPLVGLVTIGPRLDRLDQLGGGDAGDGGHAQRAVAIGVDLVAEQTVGEIGNRSGLAGVDADRHRQR